MNLYVYGFWFKRVEFYVAGVLFGKKNELAQFYCSCR